MIKPVLILAATTAHCRLSIQGTFSISSCGVSQWQATCRYNVKPSKNVFFKFDSLARASPCSLRSSFQEKQKSVPRKRK